MAECVPNKNAMKALSRSIVIRSCLITVAWAKGQIERRRSRRHAVYIYIFSSRMSVALLLFYCRYHRQSDTLFDVIMCYDHTVCCDIPVKSTCNKALQGLNDAYSLASVFNAKLVHTERFTELFVCSFLFIDLSEGVHEVAKISVFVCMCISVGLVPP